MVCKIIEKLFAVVMGIILFACFIMMISTDTEYALLGSVLFIIFLGLQAILGFVVYLIERSHTNDVSD